MQAGFEVIETWVFDLDNTLYPPRICLFDQIEDRMTSYVMQQLDVSRADADQLRVQYWRTHGTTLAGLMCEHQIDPLPYLSYVHDIDFSVLSLDPDLKAALIALPGRRIIYTNGSAGYARKVAAARGILDAFDAVYGVEDADFHPKPSRAAFDKVFGKDGLHPTRAIMFEDEARNLKAPHEMGLRTVHVHPTHTPEKFIDYHTDDLSLFLRRLQSGTAVLHHC